MTTMEELREKIARAINNANGRDRGLTDNEMRDLENDYGPSWQDWIPETDAALRAIEEAGYEVRKKQECAHSRKSGSGDWCPNGQSMMRWHCEDCGHEWEAPLGQIHLEEPRC